MHHMAELRVDGNGLTFFHTTVEVHQKLHAIWNRVAKLDALRWIR
jgi:hypothetical protein